MDRRRKIISIVTGCFNEAGNLQELYDRLLKTMALFPEYGYEIIVADNCSTDGSRAILRRIAAQDKNFKVILNANNFGSFRSGHNAFLQASGDAVVLMCSDLQDPPELIAQMIRKWEEGHQVVAAIKSKSEENALKFLLRKGYYRLLAWSSESSAPMIRDFTGFGLYDRKFMEALKKYNEPIPYLRGMVSEIGFRRAEIEYVQARRSHGRSKHNLYALYDYAMTGFVSQSRLPLRLATFSGFCLAGVSLVIAFGYFVYKLLYWDTFSLGLAPLVIGLFFFAAVQLVFIGIIGEYVGAVLTHVKNHPLAIEDERLNFDEPVRLLRESTILCEAPPPPDDHAPAANNHAPATSQTDY
jgi:polyisoprenyl-phosphate glycosyltransferase